MPRRASTSRGRLRELAQRTQDVMASDAMLDVLNELRTSERARASIKNDTRAFLRHRGIKLGRAISVEFTETSPYVVCCTYNYGYHKVTYCYTLY